jgi:VWFA-related protein
MKIGAAVLISLLAFAAVVPAQRPQRSPQPGSFSAGVTAILVDVVVRDKHGRPVVDLTAHDFEIQEDKVAQRLGSFSVVERGGGIGIKVGRRVNGPATAAPGSTPTETAALPPAADQPTVALVFDALRPEPLALAQKAALAYLPMTDGSEGRIGVFASQPGLRVLQPYTGDTALVRKAVYSLAPAGTAKQEAEAERRHALNERLVTLDALGIGRDSIAFSSEGGNPTSSQALVEQQMTELEMRMLRTFESLDRDHRGFGSADALLSVIQSLAVMPGRKTLVYLSEGLPASPSMQARLDGVVSVANRGNVSVYAIDAAGLRTESVLTETRREVDAAAQERMRQNSVSRDPTNGPLMRLVERTEDLIRLDPHGGLARLAEDTGGFLIRDTNDLSSAFRRIDEDNRFHYLLTYTPSNADFDGKFRTIQVKVKREGMQVFARKGYLAVRRAAPGTSYEAAALAAIDRGTPPNAFPISATGFVFPAPGGPATVPVVVQVKARDLHFQVDEKRGTYAAQAAIVARIKNASGHPVRTLSQLYVLTGAAQDIDAARGGEILFYRQPELPPGVYALEVVVHDAMVDRASARLSTLTVPANTGGRNLASTLVVVRQTEKVPAADRTSGRLFYYGDMLLYPNAGEPLRKGRDTELMFYFAFYGSAAPPSATLDILHSGGSLASTPLELPRAASGERVQHVGKLPIDKFPAGTYELRLRLRTGNDEQLRTTFFTIAQ